VIMMISDQLHYADPQLISGKHPSTAGLTRMDMMVYTSHRPRIPPNSAHNLRRQERQQRGLSSHGARYVVLVVRTTYFLAVTRLGFLSIFFRVKYKNIAYACI
jgi:hypothetical protein